MLSAYEVRAPRAELVTMEGLTSFDLLGRAESLAFPLVNNYNANYVRIF